jgi:WD40 repeat protein
MATGNEILRIAGHKEMVYSIAFSPDGKILASGCEDGTIQLWEVITGKKLLQIEGGGGHVLSVSFSPAGRLLASGHANSTILIWDVAALLKDKK